MTAKEALEAAKELGFDATGQYSHGQPIFKKGNRYITPFPKGEYYIFAFEYYILVFIFFYYLGKKIHTAE